MYWRRETSLAPARIQALDHPALSLVSVPTMLCHVLVCVGDITVEIYRKSSASLKRIDESTWRSRHRWNDCVKMDLKEIAKHWLD